MDVKLNYISPEALVPGQDDTLDHICNYLVNSQPLFESPIESGQTRTAVEEDAFFAKLEQAFKPHCDLEYERWFRHTSRLNVVDWSRQSALHYLPFGTRNVLNKTGKPMYLPFLRMMENGSRGRVRDRK